MKRLGLSCLRRSLPSHPLPRPSPFLLPARAFLSSPSIPAKKYASSRRAEDETTPSISFARVAPEPKQDLPTLPDPETLKPLERIEGLNFTAEELAKLSKDRAERRASVCAVPLALAHSTRAHALAKQLAIPCLDSRRAAEQAHDFLLLVGPKLSLQVVTKPPLEQKAGPVFADFLAGRSAHRSLHGNFDTSSPIVRACTLPSRPFSQTRVLDATGGLGVDAFTLASLGFQVTVCEQDPLIYSLLLDAYHRGMQILSRLSLRRAESFAFVASLSPEERPDVIYLDPMYPNKDKVKALPKKDMMIARRLLQTPVLAAEMVARARALAKAKVVLKRPKYEPDSEGTNAIYRGRTTRFEVFNAQ